MMHFKDTTRCFEFEYLALLNRKYPALLSRCKRRYQTSSPTISYFCWDTFAMALGLSNEMSSDKVKLTSVRDFAFTFTVGGFRCG